MCWCCSLLCQTADSDLLQESGNICHKNEDEHQCSGTVLVSTSAYVQVKSEFPCRAYVTL